jgi:hypothetical protein
MAPKQDKTGVPQQTPAGQVPQPFAAPVPGTTHSHPIHLQGGSPPISMQQASQQTPPSLQGGSQPNQTSPSSCTKPPLPTNRSGIPPGGELRVAAHQLAEEQEELEQELGEIGEEEQEGLLDQEEEEGSESQDNQTVNIRTTAKGTQQDSEGSLGQQPAAKITTLGNQPYKHL